jgi:hypothetical protein
MPDPVQLLASHAAEPVKLTSSDPAQPVQLQPAGGVLVASGPTPTMQARGGGRLG